jgi:dTDP-4-dehydrorhamnose 3,5-epimerase-like enzyme
MLVKNKFFENRGSLYTIYDSRDFDINFVQDKISKSYQGVIRGFHGDDVTWKLITCLHGRLKLITYDVDRDVKEEYILDGDDKESVSILVPPRVLNGHQCLSSHCIFHYKWSHYYTGPENQWSVNYNDSDINPQWNNDFPSIISDRDKDSPSLKELKEWIKKT